MGVKGRTMVWGWDDGVMVGWVEMNDNNLCFNVMFE